MDRGFRIGGGENYGLAYERPQPTLAFNTPDYRHLSWPVRDGVPQGLDGAGAVPINQARYHPRWAIMQLCITLALWTAVIAVVQLAITWL